MKKFFLLLFILIIAGGAIFIGLNIKNDKELVKGPIIKKVKKGKKMLITIDEQVFVATLEDNETTKEFIKVLPLNIKMEDLNDNEKYYYFKTSFPTDEKNYQNIHSGDIMLFGDNCLVIFYEDHISYYNYTKIGKIDNIESFKDKIKNYNSFIKLSLK